MHDFINSLPYLFKKLKVGPAHTCIRLEVSIDLITMGSNKNTMNVHCIKPQWHSSERTKRSFFHSVFVRYNQTDVTALREHWSGKETREQIKQAQLVAAV